MKKTFPFTLFTCFICTALHAQESTTTVSRNRYIQIDAGIGYLNTNLKSINASLKSLGYNPIKDNYVTLSVSPAYFMGRFLFRAEYSIILANQVKQAGQVTTTFNGHTTGFAIGYAIIQKSGFRLSPYIGINSFTTSLQLIDQSPVVTMNELVNNPHRTSKIDFSNASLDIGVQLEKIATLKNTKWDCPQNGKYMTVGARLGLNWSPGKIKARYNGNQLAGAPEYGLQGPYLKLSIGIGSKIRDLKWK